MNHIVLDLEWNQSPRGKEGRKEGLPFEIIEIGAVKLDDSYHYVDQFSELVRPMIYRQLHYKTREILNIDMDQLKRSRNFRQVIRDFFEWCGEDYVMCTWGSMDLTELQRNIAFFGLRSPIRQPLLYYDIQKMFSLLYDDGKSRKALKDAVEQLGIEEDIPFHSAIDDTIYTSRVMQNMNMKAVEQYVSVDYFRIPDKKEDEIHLVFDRYAKYVSRCFSCKDEALKDKEVGSTDCYKCGRTLRKKIRWFPMNGKTMLCLSCCPEHGLMKGKVRIKHAENGKTYIVKTVKLISEEDAEKIRLKKTEIQTRKKLKLQAAKKAEGKE